MGRKPLDMDKLAMELILNGTILNRTFKARNS